MRKNAVIGKTKRRSLLRSSWNSGLAWTSRDTRSPLMAVRLESEGRVCGHRDWLLTRL